MIDFTLSDEQSLIVETVRDFVRRELMPHDDHIEKLGYVPDEMVDRLCLVGSAEHCAERIEELRGLGVTHLNLYDQTEDFEGQMERYAAEILPRLQLDRAV